jgi:hypothetical protein
MQYAVECPIYLGVHISERALSKFFDHIERMPTNNPGYDFLCGKGFKIDVKSACLTFREGHKPHWTFRINKNKIADYFLCIGYDSRMALNPMKVWLIPGEKVNDHISLSITNIPNILIKWAVYEQSLDRVKLCCSKMRGE